MSSSKYDGYKNRYSCYETIKLGISVILTRLFYPGAKLISYPVYLRGRKSLVYGKNLSIGYGCRFDLINAQKQTLFIGDDAEIGDYCHFVATDEVRIGNNFLCASKVFISDTNHGSYNGKNCSRPDQPPTQRELVSNAVVIGDNVWLGDNVVVLPGVHLGNGVIIGANSVVTHDIPDNTIAAGSPARPIKVFNRESKEWVYVTD